MARRTDPPIQPKHFDSIPEIDSAIQKLRRRLSEVELLREEKVHVDDQRGDNAESSIRETILSIFGPHSPEYSEHQYHSIWAGARGINESEHSRQQKFQSGISATLTMLQGLVQRLHVVFLWILDATSILRFRAEWISRSVYGAAIVSVLGTSVGVYQDAFNEQKYPFEGRWEVKVRKAEQTTFVANHTVVLAYSRTAKVYWGY